MEKKNSITTKGRLLEVRHQYKGLWFSRFSGKKIAKGSQYTKGKERYWGMEIRMS